MAFPRKHAQIVCSGYCLSLETYTNADMLEAEPLGPLALLEPGYAEARIAPRLRRLTWARGNVPTLYGLIGVEINGDLVNIDSPIPVILELEG